ncbi:MAG TPA: transposase [Ktedonobacterales bacterium]
MNESSTTRKTYKYKLRPTPEQAACFAQTVRFCRELYNAGLQERRDAWRMQHVSLNRMAQNAELPGVKEVRPEGARIHSQVLQDVMMRLDRAFKAFFERVHNGEKAGYPRFKSRSRFHSFTYPQWGNGATLDNGFLVLSKIGRVAVRWSRPMEGTPKTVTITEEPDGWYACFSCKDVPVHPLLLTGQETGIDLGLESFATFANGEQIVNPRNSRKAQAAIAKANRRLSRRKKFSKRWRKAAKLLAKKYQQVKRQRRDFQHKAALVLVQQYDTIYYEDLQVANMAQNGHLAKSIYDAGWSQFCAILAFKAENAGKQVIAVNPAYTSQVCANCGLIVWKGLSTRWHECPECGASLHRDHNSAQAILRVGQTHRGVTTWMRDAEPRRISAL